MRRRAALRCRVPARPVTPAALPLCVLPDARLCCWAFRSLQSDSEDDKKTPKAAAKPAAKPAAKKKAASSSEEGSSSEEESDSEEEGDKKKKKKAAAATPAAKAPETPTGLSAPSSAGVKSDGPKSNGKGGRQQARWAVRRAPSSTLHLPASICPLTSTMWSVPCRTTHRISPRFFSGDSLPASQG